MKSNPVNAMPVGEESLSSAISSELTADSATTATTQNATEGVRYERRNKVRQLGDGPPCAICKEPTYTLEKSSGEGSWAWCPRFTCGSPTTTGRFEDLAAAYRRTEETLGISLGYGISYNDEGEEWTSDDSGDETSGEAG